MSGGDNVIPFQGRGAPDPVSFGRLELAAIFGVYGKMVARGEWRDYAIDMTPEAAVFSIFRRMGERPAFRVEKRPKNAARQGAYAVVSSDGRVLKRGRDLAQVLTIFNRALLRLEKTE